MHAVNPMFILRNHRVEAVIEAATQRQDYVPFDALLTVLRIPYQNPLQFAHYALPPQPEERVRETFCGT
jgi:uncharacterized protein YdiU (UPF0061 family)